MRQPSQPASPVLQIRTSTTARAVFGFVLVLLTILGIGLYSEGKLFFGVATFVAACAMFVHGWFQSIELVDGNLAYFRPFLKTLRISLNQVTQVRLLSPQARRTPGSNYRRYQLFQSDKMLCSFNPKLFAAQDVACLLEQIRHYSPGVEIENALAEDDNPPK